MPEKRVVVVGGSELFAVSLARWLERCGARVWVAHDGRTALELLWAQPADLVVFDPVLPVAGAQSLLTALAQEPELQALSLVLVCRPRQGPEKVARDAFYLHLPLDPREVEEVIRDLVDRCGAAPDVPAAPAEPGADAPAPAVHKVLLARSARAWQAVGQYLRQRRAWLAGLGRGASRGRPPLAGETRQGASYLAAAQGRKVPADRSSRAEWGNR